MPYEKLLKNQSELIIGMKQTLKAMERNEVAQVFIAEDADQDIINPIVALTKKLNIPHHYVPSKRELGTLCGIEVGTSTASVRRQ